MVNESRHIQMQGIVQGVGMRPFVYRLAVERDIAGWVLNARDGVHIEISGEPRVLDDFVRTLQHEAPSAARIETITQTIIAQETSNLPISESPGFEIRSSADDAEGVTLVSPDLATCDACLQELHDSSDRRFHYPFINCTNCGPRFTIIDGLPYDRPRTSMATFSLCALCEAEYHDPADRRFHAQPDACFVCGPRLTLVEKASSTTASSVEESDELIARCAALLRAGDILAIKSLGGYHLVCDATNEEAVMRLRLRKRRPARPLALMVQSCDDARALCSVDEHEAALLASPARPIVLLSRLRDTCRPADFRAQEAPSVPSAPPGASLSPFLCSSIAPSVAGILPELGIMLPSTPVQDLLIRAVGAPLVMTSGNVSSEPIIGHEDEAHILLVAIADAFLDNDRPILSRYDDSVVRVIDGRPHMIRRARGYAPLPVAFSVGTSFNTNSESSPSHESGSSPDAAAKEACILAWGAEQKSTFCLAQGGSAFVSQHLGDLENASGFNNYRETMASYQRLFALKPTLNVCDKHPEYLSSKEARAQSLPLVEVQHHHAHIAAVLAEHGITQERTIGIAFDGTGYGDDGSIWGGEVLIASLQNYERFAHLVQLPLPGGTAAIKHPDRMAYALLQHAELLNHPAAQPLLAALGADTCRLLDQMIQGNINTPLTSSMGRLFDAVSALLGICIEATYDGQPAIELEAALHGTRADVTEPLRAKEDVLQDSDGDFTEEPGGGLAKDPGGGESAKESIAWDFTEESSAQNSSSTSTFGASGTSMSDAPDAASAAGTSDAPDAAHTLRTKLIFDPTPLVRSLLDMCATGASLSDTVRHFHDAVCALILEIASVARAQTGLSTVALSGGVFMNHYLLRQVVPLLKQAGFIVLLHKELPTNDGCISYGQAAVAAARLASGKINVL